MTMDTNAEHFENYEELANAIVIRAVEDYRRLKRKAEKHPDDKLIRDEMRHIERFFKSQWFYALTSINPDRLIRLLNAEQGKVTSERRRWRGNTV